MLRANFKTDVKEIKCNVCLELGGQKSGRRFKVEKCNLTKIWLHLEIMFEKKLVFICLTSELDVSKNKQIYLTKILLFLKEKHNFKRVIQLHKLLNFFSFIYAKLFHCLWRLKTPWINGIIDWHLKTPWLWYNILNVRPLNLYHVIPQKSPPPGHSHGLPSTLKLYNRLRGKGWEQLGQCIHPK